ncbi:hypothetical protein PsYK624_071740 [Phanerochaete sordida]|uniref:Alpha/beta-hydrolase n=1 Tax=Phanerochaete sordida TaxID=48140 RepID=A0A9P3G9Z1_9APHY|nr:hypothetical protein PsYK624_071740 [Phanerochaete sordida]
MITINCRDYRGSSPYTAEELAELHNPDIEVAASTVRRWGREIALFLAYVCQTMGIPATTGKGAKEDGGLVLVTWSLSGIAALSILGDPRTLGNGLANTLPQYLRKVILYDPPCIVYGYTLDVGLPFPLTDPSIPPEKIPDAFVDWASSYFAPVPEGVPITVEALLKYHMYLPCAPTLRTVSPEERERTVDREIGTRSLAVMGTDMAIRQRHARCAFSDADAVLPNVELLVFWCDQSVWFNTWGAKVFGDLVSEAPSEGKRKRAASIFRIRGANHCIHCDEPEKMVRLFAEHCRPS